ncbi:hypothetical protein RCO48_23655 [Peribacillus frigoritolerans]|nr:hypothetical protein [Peribacillus frigoritolerans]
MTRQILTALGVAFVLSLALPAIVFFIFPLSDWSLLWEKVVMGITLRHIFAKPGHDGRADLWSRFGGCFGRDSLKGWMKVCISLNRAAYPRNRKRIQFKRWLKWRNGCN